MKRLFVFALAMFVLASAAWARSAEDIISDLRDAKHAQYVNVGQGLLGLARVFSQSVPGVSSGVTSMRMLDLSDCKSGVRSKFRKQVADLYKDKSYEEMMTSEKDDNRSVVLMRGDDKFIDEIVVVRASDNSDMIVVIKGHISVDDVNKVLSNTGYYPPIE